MDRVDADRRAALERPARERLAVIAQDGIARVGQSVNASTGLLFEASAGVGTPRPEADRGASGPGTPVRRRPSKQVRRSLGSRPPSTRAMAIGSTTSEDVTQQLVLQPQEPGQDANGGQGQGAEGAN